MRIMGITIVFLILNFFIIIGSAEEYNINDKGEDCDKIGTWDEVKKTCNLNKDVTGTINIVSNGIVLNGGQHTITSSGETAIKIENKNNVFIKNFMINIPESSKNGIHIIEGSNVNIIRNTIQYNGKNDVGGNGINIEEKCTSGNRHKIISNTISSTTKSGDGIHIKNSCADIKNNRIADMNIGILLEKSSFNEIVNNEIKGHADGLEFKTESKSNKIYDNYFNNINNIKGIEVVTTTEWNTAIGKDTYNILGVKPIGGNFWGGNSGYTTCTDTTDPFNICDKPYNINNDNKNIDKFPLTLHSQDVPAANCIGNTRPGKNVKVIPFPSVGIEFGEILECGDTTVNIYSKDPGEWKFDKEGYTVLRYYEMITTAKLADKNNYIYAGFTKRKGSTIKLEMFHLNGKTWERITENRKSILTGYPVFVVGGSTQYKFAVVAIGDVSMEDAVTNGTQCTMCHEYKGGTSLNTSGFIIFGIVLIVISILTLREKMRKNEKRT